MRLFHDPLSTSSRPIPMFAEEHGAPLELELVSLREGAQKRPEYLALNPNGCSTTPATSSRSDFA